MVSVVGIGPGNFDYLIPLAYRRIREAEILIGGRRILSLFPEVQGEKIALQENVDLGGILRRFQRVVILSSGDPLLFGVLDWVLRCVPQEEVEVIPGVSSVQYFLARLKVPLKDTAVVSLHGREGDVVGVVRHYRTVVVFTDEVHTPVMIARTLCKAGLTTCRIYVGENLSSEEECIHCFGVEELAAMENRFGLNLVVIQRCIPSCSAFQTTFSGVDVLL
ncbi:MAG: precorrin-6y C5,15-methyltransferase (decarboxylating) subunit CbiE [Candidatus Caldatribacteriaceae bacterium]